MSNTITNSIGSSEIDITQNVYKLETDHEKHNLSSKDNKNQTNDNDNLNKTDKVFVPIDDYNKDGDKINTNGAKKDFAVYGYYVREPIWVNMESEGARDGDDGGRGVAYDPESRNPFVRLVFFLVFVMLMITTIFGFACMHVNALKDLFSGKTGGYIMLGSLGVILALSYVMGCVRCCRVPPCNVICLALTVIAMSAVVGFTVVKSKTILVMFAVITTAAIVFVCFLLAYSSFDFTKWLLYVVVIGVVLSVLFMCIFFVKIFTGETFPILMLVVLFVATMVSAVMLTIEIQMVLGGKTVELEENDYAYGAFMIYISIIDIFLKLVQWLGIVDALLQS